MDKLPRIKTLRVDDLTTIFQSSRDIKQMWKKIDEAQGQYNYPSGSAYIDEDRKVMSFSGTCLWDSHIINNKLKAWEKKGWILVSHPRV
jgi:hypothetical protein